MMFLLGTPEQNAHTLKVYLNHSWMCGKNFGDSDSIVGQCAQAYGGVLANPEVLADQSLRNYLLQSLYDEPLDRMNYDYPPEDERAYVLTPVKRTPDKKYRGLPHAFNPRDVRNIKRDMCEILLQTDENPSVANVLEMMKVCMIPQKNTAGEVEAVYIPQLLKKALQQQAMAKPDEFMESVAAYKSGDVRKDNFIGDDAWVPEALFAEIEVEVFGSEIKEAPVAVALPVMEEMPSETILPMADLVVAASDPVVSHLSYQYPAGDVPRTAASYYASVAQELTNLESCEDETAVLFAQHGIATSLVSAGYKFERVLDEPEEDDAFYFSNVKNIAYRF